MGASAMKRFLAGIAGLIVTLVAGITGPAKNRPPPLRLAILENRQKIRERMFATDFFGY
jgi:hypothetical protein